MTIIKKKNYKYWHGSEKKGVLVHCWWEDKLIPLLWKAVWGFLKKLTIELADDPAIPLIGTHPKDLKLLP